MLVLLLARHAACRWASPGRHADGLRARVGHLGRDRRSPAAALLWGGLRRYKRELQPRDGFLLVSLTWVLLPAVRHAAADVGARHRPADQLHDAYFEAMSGLTDHRRDGARRARRAAGVDQRLALPSCNWLGGLGILVLAVAILPLLGVGGTPALQGRDRRAR